MFKLSILFRNPIGILSFCILIGLVFAAPVQHAGSTDQSASNFLPPSPTPTPEIPHTLVGSYYTLENNINAKLLLNNKGIRQLAIQPTLYNLQGQELQIAPVTVEPNSHRFIDLADWAAIGGESYRSGNIKLFHYGQDLELGAQIYLTDEVRSLSFEEKLTELGKFNSQRQEACVRNRSI